MNVEESLIRYLQSDTTLASYLGNRIYFINMPPNVQYPAMTIQKISCIRDQAYVHNPKTANAWFQFTVITESYPQLKTITERINSTGVLLDFVGVMGTSGVKIDYTEFSNENEINIDPSLKLYGSALDWKIYYHEV